MRNLILLALCLKCVSSASDERQGKITKPAQFNLNGNEENARKFAQRYNSFNPVMFLVDNKQENHDSAANFLKIIVKVRPSLTRANFMLMRFNTSGVTSVLETTKNNRNRFEDLLRHKTTEEGSSVLDNGRSNGSAGFFAILNAAKVLPLNSSIVMFVSRGLIDEDLAQIAANTVKKNNIQVFVVWGGPYPATNGEDRLLYELALHSGGEFLPSSGRQWSSEDYELPSPGYRDNIAMILLQRNIRGEHSLYFPVDSGVTGIHITISPNITLGMLTTPKGQFLDILNSVEVVQYTTGSFTRFDPVTGTCDVHLNTTTASTRDIGVWRLRVAANARVFYNVTVLAHTKINADAIITLKNTTDISKAEMKLNVTGDITSITHISFVNKDGQKVILDNVNFTLNKGWENYMTAAINKDGTNQRQEINVEVENIPKRPFYVVVNGKDAKGHNFTRMSYIQSNIDKTNFQTPSLTIDVGLGSELITQPNRQPQILFEVTNNGNRAVAVQFVCRDEQSILMSMTPYSAWISPQQTVTVRVTLVTKPGSYSDLITLTASGVDIIEKKAIVDVGINQNTNDNTWPEIDYTFTSDCTGQIFASCESGTWVVEVKAKDTGSGLLQLTSRPKGINFPHGFITGTREQVTGYFAESCCEPDLELIAVDRSNNRRTRSINAYRANLGPAAIAAIVLGILIIILIIIAIVFICRRCFRAKKESYDLPTYRAPARR